MAELAHEGSAGAYRPMTPTERLREEEITAWNRYRDATVNLTGQIYIEIEPWAFAALNNVRTRIKRQRRELGIPEPEPSED